MLSSQVNIVWLFPRCWGSSSPATMWFAVFLPVLIFQGHINVLSASQAAQIIGNPPGTWDNNGTGRYNVDCIPHAKVQPPSLNDPLGYMTALQGLIASGSLGRMETPIQYHIMTTIHIAQWNTIAAYHPTAVPAYPTGVDRRPTEEASTVNINTALLYCTLRVVEKAFPTTVPQAAASVTQVMAIMGLKPDNHSLDTTTPVGIGNRVAAAALERHVADGYNSLGDSQTQVNKRMYSQYNDFIPVNTAYEMKDITKWQPLLETNGQGYFFVQQHITAQSGLATPTMVSQKDIDGAVIEGPYQEALDMAAYEAQAQQVLKTSAELTDRQKFLAEYFDDKWVSFASMALAISKALKFNATQHVGADLHTNCMGDGIIAAWKEKIRHNAVRPISAIHHLYRDKEVQGWVQFNGTKTMKGQQWLSYLRTMPHADYPSGTSCVCGAFAEFYKLLLGSDEFPTKLIGPTIFKKGCSRREPGVTPAADVSVTWNTWDDFARECSQSRMYAGVHFQPAIDAGLKLCSPIGQKCFAQYQQLLSGKAGAPVTSG